jgi:GT2 family glycosyltransferase
MIPVLGFCSLKRFDLAERLLASIDYPVEHLVIIDNSGTKTWQPKKPELVKNLWFIQVPYGLGLVGAWNLIVKSTPYSPYWLLVNDDAYFEPGALEIIAEQVNPFALNFVEINTRWSAVVFGEGMIERTGLYDERFYPLYFDDNDLERRVNYHNVPINHIPAKVHHDNSSTLNSGYAEQNNKSYINNHRLYEQKQNENDYTPGNWDLMIRRRNRWD